MDISARGRTIQASPIRKFKPYADDALKKGIKVYFLNIGDPDIPTPQPIIDAFHSFNDPVPASGHAPLASVKIVPLTLSVENGYRLPPRAEIEAKITPRTKAILLCSPNNPTGTVYTEEELRRVADIVKERNLFFIGDEVYKELIYDGAAQQSILEFPDIEDRAIVVDSISKRFSCCGARNGCA